MNRILIASIALLPAWAAATAQDSNDYRVRLGVGAQLQPNYIGADGTQIAPYWRFDLAQGSNPFRFKAPDDGFAISVVSKDGFSFGPELNIESSRKNSDVGAPVGKVPTTFEVGAFAQYYMLPSLRLRADVRKGVNGHEGVVSSIGIDQVWRDGDRYVISVGPRVLLSDARYQRAYFGVTPAVALITGLPAYRPGSGVHALAATTGMTFQFNPRWGLFGYGRYERLVGDAARSPIVREFGSRNQFSAGAGLSYTFTVAR